MMNKQIRFSTAAIVLSSLSILLSAVIMITGAVNKPPAEEEGTTAPEIVSVQPKQTAAERDRAKPAVSDVTSSVFAETSVSSAAEETADIEETTAAEETADTEATAEEEPEETGSEWTEEEVYGTLYVNTDGIYSREKAVMGSEKVKQYELNAPVEVVAATNTYYYKLSDGSFIHFDYLSNELTEVPEWTEEAVSMILYVNTDGIYSREKAIEGSTKADIYSLNDEVEAVAFTDTDYYKISDGTFIHSDYLSEAPVSVTEESSMPDVYIGDSEVLSVEWEMFELVNQYRAQYGLEPFQWDYNAYPAARIRSGELLTSISHTRPNGMRFSSVFSEVGYSPSSSGENIVYYYSSARDALSVLINSPSHRELLLSTNYTHIAISCTYSASSTWGYYWVQEFTRP